MNIANKTFCTGAAIALLSLSLTSFADTIYKWTDNNGQVHFSQQPSETHESEAIQTEKTRPFGQSKFMPQDTAGQQTTNTKPAPQSSEAEQGDVVQAQTTQKSPDLCKKAQENKSILMGKLRVRQNGKIMSEDERQQQLNYMDEIIKNNC